MRTYIRNARILAPHPKQETAVLVENGKIAMLEAGHSIPGNCLVVDAKGLYLSPGFVDVHVHGGGGHGVMDADPAGIAAMCDAHARHGTTAVLPTTLAAPIPQLLQAARAVEQAAETVRSCEILGVHFEGPFLSPAQQGAQAGDALSLPTEENINALLSAGPLVRMVGAAPELPGGLALGTRLQAAGITASIAHSNATAPMVRQAIEAGYSDVTHIYSACSGVVRENAYRIAGVIEAGLLYDELSVQLIADLKHLPPELLQLVLRCKGAGNIALITDGLEFAAADLQEGQLYRQANGVEVLYEDGVMKLPSRQAFAGSVATMRALVYNMWKQGGASLAQAVEMATATPARLAGVATRKGRVAPGYDADLLVFDEDLRLHFRMARGQVLQNNLPTNSKGASDAKQ